MVGAQCPLPEITELPASAFLCLMQPWCLQNSTRLPAHRMQNVSRGGAGVKRSVYIA